MSTPDTSGKAVTYPFGRAITISDICLLVDDIERSVAFYAGKLGFEIWRKHGHFADFRGLGITLACWRIDHFHQIAHRKPLPQGAIRNRALVAVQFPNFAEVDACYESLCRNGIEFTGPPVDLPWNARGAYFLDPDDTVWEIYGYRDGIARD